jgi:preprotein translocase subunit YajC
MPINFMLLSSVADSSSAAAPNAPWWSSLVTFIPIVLVFVAMYFLMIRPQKKRQKEEQQMRNNVRVGDMITTIGGICGRVINIKEDELVIETGADRSKMTIRKWALQTVDTVHDTPAVDDDDDDDI